MPKISDLPVLAQADIAPATDVSAVVNAGVTKQATILAQVQAVFAGLNGILKSNAGTLSAAVAGTDYAAPTSGTSILYGNGAGGFSNAIVGSGLTFVGGTLAATGGGTGTVTSVSVATANGFAGSVANPTTTPAITITVPASGVLKSNGTAIGAATAGADYSAGTAAQGTGIVKTTTGTGALTVAANTDLPVATATQSGALPTPPNNATTFLRGDATFTQVGLTNGVTGTLPIANGGTNGTATPTAGGIPYGTGTAFAFTTAGTAGQAWLSGGAGAPTRTTGTLALAGNFATSGAFASTFTMTGTTTVTFPTSGTLLSTAAAVTVAQGGTGLGTLTLNNVILGNGTSNPTFVAPGSSGNVLTSNGTTWTSAAAAGGGAWTKISTVTASASTTLDVAFSGSYNSYVIKGRGLRVSVNNVAVQALLKVAGTFKTTDYNYHSANPVSTAATYAATNATAGAGTSIQIANAVGDAGASGSVSFDIYVSLPAATNTIKSINWTGNAVNGSQEVVSLSGAGSVGGSAAAITELRIQPASGNFSTGTLTIWGVEN